ncbi:hypothetical protein K2X40_03715 [Candidatus Babeliales bacterium]|nr:hypothetical protein [Candidatus Babeliales bacterium]
MSFFRPVFFLFMLVFSGSVFGGIDDYSHIRGLKPVFLTPHRDNPEMQKLLAFDVDKALSEQVCIAKDEQGPFPYHIMKGGGYFGEDVGLPYHLSIKISESETYEICLSGRPFQEALLILKLEQLKRENHIEVTLHATWFALYRRLSPGLKTYFNDIKIKSSYDQEHTLGSDIIIASDSCHIL